MKGFRGAISTAGSPVCVCSSRCCGHPTGTDTLHCTHDWSVIMVGYTANIGYLDPNFNCLLTKRLQNAETRSKRHCCWRCWAGGHLDFSRALWKLLAVSFSFEQFVNSFFFLWFHIQTSEECRLTCGQGCHQSGEPDNTKTTLIVKCRLCKPNAPYREICLEFHMWEINVTIYTSLFYQQRHAKRYFVQVINPGVVFVWERDKNKKKKSWNRRSILSVTTLVTTILKLFDTIVKSRTFSILLGRFDASLMAWTQQKKNIW